MAIFGDLRGGKRPKPGLLETASAMHKVALAERLFARAKKAVNKAKDRRSMAVCRAELMTGAGWCMYVSATFAPPRLYQRRF